MTWSGVARKQWEICPHCKKVRDRLTERVTVWPAITGRTARLHITTGGSADLCKEPDHHLCTRPTSTQHSSSNYIVAHIHDKLSSNHNTSSDYNIQIYNMSNRPEGSTETIELTETEQAFKHRVETAMNSLPRFLFRIYHSTSGGYRDLNTTAAITPLAFSCHNRGPPPSPCFYKHNPGQIASVASMHLRGGRDMSTIFSSWSQSLNFVLGHAASAVDAHICILDTTLLDPSVFVLHTEQFLSVVGSPTRSFSHELLAFGVVSGRAFQAVPYSDLGGVLGNYPYGLVPQPALTATMLRSLTGHFKDDFKLSIAAYVTALAVGLSKDHEARERLIRMLSKLPVPAGWEHDPKIMNLQDVIFRRDGDCQEAVQAAGLMRDVVRVSLIPRPSRDVLGLQIDAEGWQGRASRLRSGR